MLNIRKMIAGNMIVKLNKLNMYDLGIALF